MEAMRQSWTDDRLDGLSERVDLGFRHVDERFDRMEASLTRLEERFYRFQLTMIVTGGGIIAALIAT
jgi:hypothetical protein